MQMIVTRPDSMPLGPITPKLLDTTNRPSHNIWFFGSQPYA